MRNPPTMPGMAGRPVCAARRGFLLMEVILALGLFAMAATGFAVALSRTADAAMLASNRMQITRILQSSMTEALSIPVLEEGVTTVSLEEEIGGAAVEIDTRVSLVEELQNEEGQQLQEIYRIEIIANWYENGQWLEERAETWRYARLYQR